MNALTANATASAFARQTQMIAGSHLNEIRGD